MHPIFYKGFRRFFCPGLVMNKICRSGVSHILLLGQKHMSALLQWCIYTRDPPILPWIFFLILMWTDQVTIGKISLFSMPLHKVVLCRFWSLWWSFVNRNQRRLLHWSWCCIGYTDKVRIGLHSRLFSRIKVGSNCKYKTRKVHLVTMYKYLYHNSCKIQRVNLSSVFTELNSIHCPQS